MNCVFSGPPRVGKSTLLERLMGREPKDFPSTGIFGTKGIVRVELKPSFSIITDQEWHEMQEEDEVDAFVTLTIIPDPSSSEDVIPSSEGVTSENISPADEPTPMETSPTSTSVVERSSETSMVLPEGTASDSYNSRYSPSSTYISLDNAPEMSSGHKETPSSSSESEVVKEYVHSETSSSDYYEMSSEDEETPTSTDVNITESDIVKAYIKSKKPVTNDVMLSKNDRSQLPNPIIVLQKAMQHRKQIQATKTLRKRHFLYLTDTGGQPEFRELLPLFLPGPTTTFIVFDLRYEFNSTKKIEFLPSDLIPVISGQVFTVKEVVNEILQNIYCSKSRSTVMFIGTHKDQLPASELQSIIESRNQDLRELLQDCPYYQEGMIVKSDQKNLIFCVDNASINKSHSFVRSAVLGLCNDTRFTVKVKPRWLLFALTLKGAQSVCMSYEDCADVAEKCGIEREDVKCALRCLHQHMSTLRYYDCEELKSIVIVKPKVLTNKLSKLLKVIISKREIGKIESVILSHDDIRAVAMEGDTFPTESLICILKYLKVIAPVHENEETRQYIFPCMLLDSQSTPPSAHQFFLSFKDFKFQVPKYLHNVILTSLLQEKDYSVSLTSTSKTKITFSKGVFNFQLFLSRKYVVLSPIDLKQISDEELSICSYVEESVEKLLISALTLLGYSEHIPERCFQCSCDRVKTQHFAIVGYEGGTCSATGLPVKLPKENVLFSQVCMFIGIIIIIKTYMY